MQTYFDIETGKFYGRFKDRASPSGWTWEQIDPDSYELILELIAVWVNLLPSPA